MALKEPGPDRSWVTWWVDAFGPRGFTSIATPDPVLASRSALAPLARTADPTRGNRDPADVGRWPCDRQALQDDLWALALALLPEAAGVWAELDHETSAAGREFEPWRAVLAVARLLDRHGVTGLEGRVRSVMARYRRERPDLLADDRVVLVIRALVALVGDDRSDGHDGHDSTSGGVTVASSDLREKVHELAADEERGVEWATNERVGRTLGRLRVERAEQTARRRGWTLRADTVAGLARAYGILPMPEPDPDVGVADGERDTSRADALIPDPTVTTVIGVTPVIADGRINGVHPLESGADFEEVRL